MIAASSSSLELRKGAGESIEATALCRPWRWLMIAALACAVVVAAALVLWVLPAAGQHVLQPYQVDRITGFLHPEGDPAGATYNVTQSKVAVGAGGLDGRGVAGATQTNLAYLPEHATDFVFASFAEQRGFFGAAILYVNVGMTMGIAPITGIPLPFVSVGGSSMIANLAAMGVLLSIHARGAPFRRR